MIALRQGLALDIKVILNCSLTDYVYFLNILKPTGGLKKKPEQGCISTLQNESLFREVVGVTNLEGIKTSGLPPPRIYKPVSYILI